MLEDESMTQKSGVHLYDKDDTAHVSVGAGILERNASLGSPSLPGWQLGYPGAQITPSVGTVIAMTSLEALHDVISTALFLPHNYHLRYFCKLMFPSCFLQPP